MAKFTVCDFSPCAAFILWQANDSVSFSPLRGNYDSST